MVLANKITVGRFIFVPMVVGSILLYADSIREGVPDDTYRWLAVGLFLLAAISDVLDGYIARRFHQRSRFGELMDPLADKCLLVATILTLTFTPWAWTFPLRFPCLVILRDILAVAGAYLVHRLAGNVEMTAHWTGKAATFLQICAVCWVMLEIRYPHPIWPTAFASVLILSASWVYIGSAIRQISRARHSTSTPVAP
jgi:CDP-diacylglycerol--glycerol-3-phosphate 3-phosphatidyltransferase/cardiolipin synthase